MKKRLNLMNLNGANEMSRERLSRVTAGQGYSVCDSLGCACGCIYAGQGGSSTNDNYNANSAEGLHTPGYSYEPQEE